MLPLIPEKLEDDHTLFYALVGGVRHTAEFTIKGHGTEPLYERYKLN